MFYPILLSLSYCFDQTSIFINPYKLLIGMYCILYPRLICFNPLHNHASNAFNLLISSCNNVHASHSYNTTGYNNTLTILYFNVLLNHFVKSSFLLLNASCAITILTFTSLRLLPSSVIIEPKYLKFLARSIALCLQL